MSYQAVKWALDAAPTLQTTERLVLVSLAECADDSGRAAYLGWVNLAERVQCSTRTVARAIASLEQRGVIRRGDQRKVAHIPRFRRPVVWDMCLDQRRAGSVSRIGMTPVTPHPMSPVSPHDTGDMTPVTDPHDTGVMGDMTPVTDPHDTGVMGDMTPVSPYPLEEPPENHEGERAGVADAFAPPLDRPAADEPPSRCKRHIDNPTPPPCGACREARERHEMWREKSEKQIIAHRENVEAQHMENLRADFERREREKSPDPHARYLEVSDLLERRKAQ